MLIHFRRVGGITENVNGQALENHRQLPTHKGMISDRKRLCVVTDRQIISPNNLVKTVCLTEQIDQHLIGKSSDFPSKNCETLSRNVAEFCSVEIGV